MHLLTIQSCNKIYVIISKSKMITPPSPVRYQLPIQLVVLGNSIVHLLPEENNIRLLDDK